MSYVMQPQGQAPMVLTRTMPSAMLVGQPQMMVQQPMMMVQQPQPMMMMQPQYGQPQMMAPGGGYYPQQPQMMSKDMGHNQNQNGQNMVNNQSQVVNVNVGGKRVNHCCHFLLCLGTGGAWSLCWLSACMCGCPSLADCPCGN